MLRLFVMSFLLVPSVSLAAVFPALEYQSVSCRLLKDDVVVKEVSSSMMTLMIEEGFGRFVQLQFGDEKLKIQYQILIEDDTAYKIPGPLVYLQNLMVGGVEVSSEFSAKDATWLRILNGEYAVNCDLNRKSDVK